MATAATVTATVGAFVVFLYRHVIAVQVRRRRDVRADQRALSAWQRRRLL